MGVDQQVGNVDLRSQVFDKAVKGFATQAYKFKQAVTISPTSAWKNTFYRESPSQLTAKGTRVTKGIPRGASFPQAAVEFEKVTANIEKFGFEDNIYWEDILSDDVDVRDRTLFRVAENVAKAVDDEIWTQLTESRSPTSIQQIGAYVPTLSRGGWNQSSAALIDNLAQATQLIAEKNYDTSNLMCFINPRDARSIKKYLTDKGAQFPSLSTDVAKNGRIGSLMGIDLIQSNSVTTSYALVVVPRICATWKELVPMQTTTKEDPYKSLTIRAVEMGVTQVTDPSCIVLISGTLIDES